MNSHDPAAVAIAALLGERKTGPTLEQLEGLTYVNLKSNEELDQIRAESLKTEAACNKEEAESAERAKEFSTGDTSSQIQTGAHAQQFNYDFLGPAQSYNELLPYADSPYPHPGSPAASEPLGLFVQASAQPIHRQMTKPKYSDSCHRGDSCAVQGCTFTHDFQRAHFGDQLVDLPCYVTVKETERKLERERED